MDQVNQEFDKLSLKSFLPSSLKYYKEVIESTQSNQTIQGTLKNSIPINDSIRENDSIPLSSSPLNDEIVGSPSKQVMNGTEKKKEKRVSFSNQIEEIPSPTTPKSIGWKRFF